MKGEGKLIDPVVSVRCFVRGFPWNDDISSTDWKQHYT